MKQGKSQPSRKKKYPTVEEMAKKFEQWDNENKNETYSEEEGLNRFMGALENLKRSSRRSPDSTK